LSVEKMFRFEREKVKVGWRNLHNEKPPHIFKIVKTKRMRVI
jgi:hypothetical protein